MEKFTRSQDRLKIYYKSSDIKSTAIVFIHGWLGNAEWWNDQLEYFKDKYTVVQIDLPGHGKSEKGRVNWSSTLYANDIKNVVEKIDCKNVILVGHSMSGAYVLEASLIIKNVKIIILVDTLKNMDKLMDYEQANELLFNSYRNDFTNAVKHFLPKFLFSERTSTEIKQRLESEFLKNDADFAVKSIEPLYKMNIRAIAQQVQIPVRAINADYTPTDVNSIRKYMKDFNYVTISNTGHYPMLEKPNDFNFALNNIIQNI
ncbi:alpha/beta fold hydrolase [Winogradskyella sediminis]|jgi:pimeloyl-ACP methyl ester carboxylesterase|uniref:alpha/beta fold hydrolase n=1 Tax=Winogradskyella sediminis TaxID=1382466 RepID=UPI003AA7FFC2